MNQFSDSSAPAKPPPARNHAPQSLDLTAAHSLYAGVFQLDPQADESGDLGFFRAQTTASCLLSESRLRSMRLARSYAMARLNNLDLIALRLHISGRLTGQMGDRTIECGAGDLVFVDLRQTLDLSISAGAEGASDLTLWLPQTKILGAIRHESELHGIVISGASPAGAVIGAALRALAEQAPKASTEDMDALCEGVLALAAKALAPELARRSAAVAPPSASFVTIRRHIDQHLHQPSLNADSLAKRFGLSRASLYRLFEPVGGIALYIRRARLARAYQEIVSRDDSSHRIGPIAYRMGFKNVSAFNRLFKDHFGVTPGEAREQAGIVGLLPAPSPAPEDLDDKETLAYWLRRLGAAPQANAATPRPVK